MKHYVTAIGSPPGQVLLACRCGEVVTGDSWREGRRSWVDHLDQAEHEDYLHLQRELAR